MAEETQPLKFRVPDEHVEEILTIMDAEFSRMTTYRLWKRLEEIIPEIAGDERGWTPMQAGPRLYIVEMTED